MRRFKFRIGTKLGLTAGIGVVLVGGMLTSQLISSEQIAELSRMVVINTANKGNAQAAGAAMTRARLAVVEITVAKSADRLAAHTVAFRNSVAEATTEIDAALNRARREEAKQLYREVKTNIEASLKAGAELGEARGKVIAGLAAGSQAGEIMKAEEAGARILEQKMLPAAKEIDVRIEKLMSTNNEYVVLRQNQLMAALDQAAQVGLGVGVLVILVLIGSAVFSVLNIARPIRRIGGVLLELANGNKAVEIPYTSRGDEVGDNARAAHTFKDNLIRIELMEAEQKDQEAAATVRRKAEMIELANAFESAVGGIVNSVSSASEQLETAAGTLSGTAEETQQLSGMVAAASEEASANVGAVASAAEEMSASVVEISRQVHDSSRIAGEAVKQAEHTDQRINELLKAAGRIGDVVKLITAIAEQTNLLALNATIEAARAGESGRGFAVVASEVKALAAQTAKATDEIGAQITGMQAATEDSVSAIKEIGATISKISDISTTIAATIEEQGAATAEIARNVSEAAKGTAEVAEKITQVNTGASSTGSASAQVLASARSLSQESRSLRSEVEKFLNTVRAA
jgi:methyl-accepting chemotaxis protein